MKQDQDAAEKTHISKHIPELLAPAGSFTACKAVIHAGADAVYLGGPRFGARAYADNFTKEELLEAVDYAHLHGRKVYLTVNTLLKQAEMEELYEYLLPCCEQGLDAVIVQDFGVMRQIHAYFKEMPVHVSTQMSVADICGAAYLKRMGAARIVTARELSLEEIQAIRSAVDIEIECFIHGALCYCYSGRCLFSSMLGGRSGNRGRCAQPCRLPYTVLDADRHRLSAKDCYPLSLKDLCAVSQLGQLAGAGIHSFKIEGRMKSAEYAAGVVSVYRRYMDEYLAGGAVHVRERDLQHLSETGSRSGFTDGYYNQRSGLDMVTLSHPAYTKSKSDSSFLTKIREQYVMQEQKIPVYANVDLKIGNPAVLEVISGTACVSVQGDAIQAARNQPSDREMIVQQLSRTGNSPYYMESITAAMDDGIFVPKQLLNSLRREALEALTQQILVPYRRKMKMSFWDTDCPKQQTVMSENMPYMFYAMVQNESQLSAALEYACIRRIYLDSSMYPHRKFLSVLTAHSSRIKAAGKQAYLVLPAVFRRKTARFYQEQWKAVEQTGIDGYLAGSMDALGFLDERKVDKKRCVLDHSLYAWSNEAKASYMDAGWMYDTIPLELNKKELSGRGNAASELIIYGHMPLMTSAQCIAKTFGRCGSMEVCFLKDRYAEEFPVKCSCAECYQTIYNAHALSLFSVFAEAARLRPLAYRLHFTVEKADKVRKVLNCLESLSLKKDITDMDTGMPAGTYTYGHFKRGVE